MPTSYDTSKSASVSVGTELCIPAWTELARNRTGGIFVCEALHTWDELLARATSLKCGFDVTHPSGDYSAAVNSAVVIIAGFLFGGDLVLMPTRTGGLHIEYTINPTRPRGAITIYSSGTTGTPKPVNWQWADLWQASAAQINTYGDMWCGYSIDSFAGIQALIAALQYARVFYVDRNPPKIEGTITVAMASPTQWRRLVGLGVLANSFGLDIKTASMGGEAANQTLLDALRSLRPGMRVTHVYGAVEFGPVFSVSDGRAGFPASFLTRELASGVRISIEDNELLLRRGDVLHHSGDIVARLGDRVYFRGRKGRIASVAGRKVSLSKVEEVLRSVAGLIDVKAFAVANSLTGSIVMVEAVCLRSTNKDRLEAQMRARAKIFLSAEEAPRRYLFVSELGETRSGKAIATPQACTPEAEDD